MNGSEPSHAEACGTTAPPPRAPTETRVHAILATELRSGLAELPVLSQAVGEVMAILQERELDYERIIATAETDPALSARLISFANSPIHFRQMKVSSVRSALVRLGPQAASEALFIAICSSVFQVPKFREHVEQIFRHSVVVARLAAHMASLCGYNARAVFLAGLMHDAGRCVCLNVAAHGTLKNEPLNEETERDLFAAIDDLHTAAGAKLAADWHLPAEVGEACRWHHEPSTYQHARLVHIADMIAHHAEDPESIDAEQIVAGFAGTLLDEHILMELVESAPKHLATVAAL